MGASTDSPLTKASQRSWDLKVKSPSRGKGSDVIIRWFTCKERNAVQQQKCMCVERSHDCETDRKALMSEYKRCLGLLLRSLSLSLEVEGGRLGRQMEGEGQDKR